jgi:hypothetical protein
VEDRYGQELAKKKEHLEIQDIIADVAHVQQQRRQLSEMTTSRRRRPHNLDNRSS